MAEKVYTAEEVRDLLPAPETGNEKLYRLKVVEALGLPKDDNFTNDELGRENTYDQPLDAEAGNRTGVDAVGVHPGPDGEENAGNRGADNTTESVAESTEDKSSK